MLPKISFEFEDQNLIHRRHKMIWVYQASFHELFEEAFSHGCELNFDQVLLQINISAPNQEQQEQIIKFLNSIQIVDYKAKTQIEAQKFFQLLSSDQFIQQLKNKFNCGLAKLMNLSQIDIGSLLLSENLLIDFLDQWRIEQIVLVYDDQQNKGNEYYQHKFEEFIKQNIKTGIEVLKISREIFIQNANELILFIKQQTEFQIDIEEGQQNCILIFTFWYSNDFEKERLIVNKFKAHIQDNILLKKNKQISIIKPVKQQNSFVNACCFEYILGENSQVILLYLNKYFTNNEEINLVISEDQKSAKFYFTNNQSEKEKLKEMVQNELSTLQLSTLKLQNQLQIKIESEDFKKQIEYVLNKTIFQSKCAIIIEKQVEFDLIFRIVSSEIPFLIEKLIKEYFDTLQIKRLPATDKELFQTYQVQNSYQFCEKTLVCYNGYLIGNKQQIQEILTNFPEIFSIVYQVRNQAVYQEVKKSIQQNHQFNLIAEIHFNDKESEISAFSFEQSELNQLQQNLPQIEKYKKVDQGKSQLQQQKNSEMNYSNSQYSLPLLSRKNRSLKIRISKNEAKYLYIKNNNLISENCELEVIFCKNFKNLIDFKEINDNCVQLITKYGIDYQKGQQEYYNQCPYIYTKIKDKFILALMNVNLYESNETECFEQIKLNIKTIFQIISQNKLKSVVLPIFGCGPCDFSFQKVSKKIFNLLLRYLKIKNIEKIVLVEDFYERFDLLKKLVQSSIHQPKYLYSFSVNGDQFNDEINIIINNAIEAKKNKVLIPVSYFQKILSHEINFQNQQIINLKTEEIFRLSSKNKQNYFQYYINQEPSDQRFNDFLNLLNKFNINICKFSYNDVFFIIENDIYFLQMDTERIKVQCKLHLETESEIFEYQEEQITTENAWSQQIVSNKQVNNCIWKFKAEIPKNFSQKFNKEIWNNFKVTKNYKLFTNLSDLQFLIDLLISTETDWQKVENTVEMVSLPNDDQDYQQISQILHNFQVINIKRIKNQKLFEKYKIAQKQMINSHQAVGSQLNEKQVNAMLWAVLSNHPKVSYDKNSDGIEIYNGEWGKGAYFTETFTDINYYKNIGGNDQTFVSLYCSVGIGKSQIMEKNRDLYRSLFGYDSNCNSDQTIYILYNNCIARAYPLFEVEFRKKSNQI